MLWGKVLVAYDGSELAKKSLETALELRATASVNRLDVVYVAEIPRLQQPIQKLEEAIEEHRDNIIAELEQKLTVLSEPCGIYQLQGREAAYVILEHAKKGDYNLIVIGSRGLTGLHEFMGSVSHTIVQHAHIPVLVIK